MNQNFNQFNSNMNGQTGNMTLSKYTAQTFGWMCAGLMITFFTALFLALTGMVFVLFSVPFLSIILGCIQLGVVFFLSAKINSIAVGTAKILFFSYSFLTGITFSGLFFAYGFGNVIGVFGLTALYFGALAAFGYFTNVDLSRLGPLFFGGIIFLVIAGLILMFVNIPILDTIVCLVGIVIFLGMTAYDTQKIRRHYHMYSHDTAMLAKASVISALELYLDFINLFIYLLRFLGNRND